MAPRLKVFTWSDGFHAFTVAASSRPKALEAWGAKQDLFATGLASQLSGGPDHDAALAAPGEVIWRSMSARSERRPGRRLRDRRKPGVRSSKDCKPSWTGWTPTIRPPRRPSTISLKH
ncbi:MAG: hypothetical protein JHC96_10650 [Brevundimonas sp.]|uniref:hypothetical protein n=1 Tax=Brevundimonas sp. TaxID=1871086 RepID=UPI001A20031E|nr:hypothetical protein [Brevundimonas sp.]MBJ7319248.1 hypothetical protein [Brevundimonas sp.]